jgi:hypothetical protein
MAANDSKISKYQSHKRTLETHSPQHNGGRALQITTEEVVVDRDNLAEAMTVTTLGLPHLAEMNMVEH